MLPREEQASAVQDTEGEGTVDRLHSMVPVLSFLYFVLCVSIICFNTAIACAYSFITLSINYFSELYLLLLYYSKLYYLLNNYYSKTTCILF